MLATGVLIVLALANMCIASDTEAQKAEHERQELIEMAIDHERQGTYDKAIQIYESILLNNPGSQENLNVEHRLGNVHYKAGRHVSDYSKAIEVLTRITQRYDGRRPKVIKAHAMLGRLYRRMGQDDKAMEHFKTVLDIVNEIKGDPITFDRSILTEVEPAISYCSTEVNRKQTALDRLRNNAAALADKTITDPIELIPTEWLPDHDNTRELSQPQTDVVNPQVAQEPSLPKRPQSGHNAASIERISKRNLAVLFFLILIVMGGFVGLAKWRKSCET
jgi:tetratricopeptide (TPR) repeat protein